MITEFSNSFLRALVESASESSRGRQHWNLHETFNEPVQRLFNSISLESYIRPHRHLIDPKFECFVSVRGMFCLYVFSDTGDIISQTVFGTELYAEKYGINVGVELAPGAWHTIVALTSGSVLFEIKAGPFRPAMAKEFATWTPTEESDAAVPYLASLQAKAALALSDIAL